MHQMKKYTPICILSLTLFIASCGGDNQTNSSTSQNKPNKESVAINEELEKETVVLEMEYFGWACPCAQWITPENKKIFEEKRAADESYGDSLFYYVIPASDSIPHPFDLTEDMNDLRFRFTGRFFKEKQDMKLEGEMGPAITFMYDEVEFISDNSE